MRYDKIKEPRIRENNKQENEPKKKHKKHTCTEKTYKKIKSKTIIYKQKVCTSFYLKKMSRQGTMRPKQQASKQTKRKFQNCH